MQAQPKDVARSANTFPEALADHQPATSTRRWPLAATLRHPPTPSRFRLRFDAYLGAPQTDTRVGSKGTGSGLGEPFPELGSCLKGGVEPCFQLENECGIDGHAKAW